MKNYQQGEPRARKLERTAPGLKVNAEITPEPRTVRTVSDSPVVDAYYAYPMKVTSATDDVDMAVWGWNEQGRYVKQTDKLKDE